MKSKTGFPVHEIAGRLLAESLKAEADEHFASMDFFSETIEAPEFPTHGRTDTGTLRAIHVAS